MSLVGGYPPQAYHPAGPALSHDLYGYPHPQSAARYQDPAAAPPHPAAVDSGAFYQNWMLNTQTDMTVATDAYGLGMGVGGPMQHHPQETQYGNGTHTMVTVVDPSTGRVRVVKRRCSANKKERRRTVSINTAFAKLRGCIPNVPSDTKLSKIKTLRLATSYIAYLMDVLNKDDPKLAEAGFKADLVKIKKESKKHTDAAIDSENSSVKCSNSSSSPASSSGSNPDPPPAPGGGKKSKGRTGWPQHVWAAELKP